MIPITDRLLPSSFVITCPSNFPLRPSFPLRPRLEPRLFVPPNSFQSLVSHFPLPDFDEEEEEEKEEGEGEGKGEEEEEKEEGQMTVQGEHARSFHIDREHTVQDFGLGLCRCTWLSACNIISYLYV